MKSWQGLRQRLVIVIVALALAAPALRPIGAALSRLHPLMSQLAAHWSDDSGTLAVNWNQGPTTTTTTQSG